MNESIHFHETLPERTSEPTTPALPDISHEENLALEHEIHGKAENETWHAEAGRKGAHRLHQLMQLGLLYEKEHGLKRGRQRIRQLVQEGRLYEQEHGLSKPRRKRRSRLAGDQLVQSFFRTLLPMLKPSYRDKVSKMLENLGKQDAA